MPERISVDAELIRKYDVSGPYYTSYPTVGKWSEAIEGAQYQQYMIEAFADKGEFPLNLYLHFPYCAKLCYFCHCHMKVDSNKKRIDKFIDYFCREIEMLTRFFDKYKLQPRFREIHFGGGSPSHMDLEQFDRVMDKVQTLVDFNKLEECALEIDIRNTNVNRQTVEHYAERGVNRISFGVQDFNPEVQKAINREQPIELFSHLLTPQIRSLFKGINFDLIYGMPLQTPESFHGTIEIVKEFAPDRMSIYNYGHAPDKLKHQRLINEADLAREEEKTRMNIDAMINLVSSGYERIGIDHYAKYDDSLAQAKRNGSLHRSFMGYTNGRSDNLLSVGPSALSEFGEFYTQNVCNNADYYAAIDSNEFPIFRGYQLNKDDAIRREVMSSLLSRFKIKFADINKQYGIEFTDYFDSEMTRLKPLQSDGIAEVSDKGINITDKGEFFVRHACKVFDKYIDKQPITVN